MIQRRCGNGGVTALRVDEEQGWCVKSIMIQLIIEENKQEYSVDEGIPG